MKTKEGVYQFRNIATEVAYLVKKIPRFISGEHGDGIVRGEFTFMIEKTTLLKRIKLAFDPNSVLNMGKIVNALKWMRISVLKLVEKNPISKPFKIFSVGCCRKCNGSGIAVNYPRQEERCARVIEPRETRKILLVLAPMFREYLTIQKRE
jgi:hypothetical protein